MYVDNDKGNFLLTCADEVSSNQSAPSDMTLYRQSRLFPKATDFDIVGAESDKWKAKADGELNSDKANDI